MHGYPGIFAVAGFFRTTVLLLGMLSTWSQSVRDKEFLLEMRLRNLEPEQSQQAQVGEVRMGQPIDEEMEDDHSDNLM
jgi:E3 ubiquitin-protein ligase MARCH6